MSIRMTVTIIGAAATMACASSAERARRFAAHGDEYTASGRYDAAVIEYRNAVKRAPDWAEGHRKLGDAYAALGKANDAYRAYSRAIDIDPSDVPSCLGAGRLLLAAGLYDEADTRARQALDREPRNPAAMLLAGRALAQLKRFDEAIGAVQTAIAADGGPSAVVALGQVKLAARDRAGAEAAFREAVDRYPSSPDTRVALADFLSSTGRGAEAEQHLQSAVAANPSSELANRALASVYVAAGRQADAEPYLETAAAQPRQTLRSTIALADFYLAAGRRDDARTILTAVTGPDKTAAKVRLAAIEYEAGSQAEAHRALDRILERSATGEAWALQARFLSSERKVDAALEAAQAAIDLDHRQASAHYIIGTIELDRGHLDRAEHAFREVLRLNRMTDEARLQLARTRLAAGHAVEAIDLAAAAGPALPARLTLARALIADGQRDRAREELTRLDAGVRSAEPAILLGSLDLADGNGAAGRARAERALALAPESVDALLLAAHSAIATQDVPAAERYLTRAIAKDPASFDAHATLSQLYISRGDEGRARATLEALVASDPQSAQARTALGMVWQKAGRSTEARQAYETALALDPGQAIAANNLARLYAADTSMTETAIGLARVAVTRMPDEPEAHDTLGWAYYKGGQLRLAARELERAVALDPQEETYRSRLAEVRGAIVEEERRARRD